MEDIIGCKNIYLLDEIISKLNICGATDEELQAISEVYSPRLEDILTIEQRS